MNNKDRKLFWDEINKPIENCNLMQFKDKIPKRLYRYRSFNTNNISALSSNKLYFSTANYYDDPFDTLIKVDFDKIDNDIKQFFNVDNYDNIINTLKSSFGINISINDFPLAKEAVSYFATDYYKLVKNTLKANTYTICFGENEYNENLWLKYADAHKGYVIEYETSDLLNTNNVILGKTITNTNTYLSLYPIYYSNVAYDATEYYKNVTTTAIFKYLKMDYLDFNKIQSQIAWEKLRICLIKGKSHSNDMEWRLFAENQEVNPVYLKIKPSAVILGLNMSEDDKNAMKAICNQLNIELYEVYLSNNYKLEKRRIK